jgi:two-component sensor histidine kinase
MHSEKPLQALPTAPDSCSGAWLLLEELNHRVANEYAIASASIRLAARGASMDARADLVAACNRLHNYAESHRAHLAPLGEVTDLSQYLERLCHTVVRSKLEERGVALRLIANSIALPSQACWKIGLIVSELITNSLRHGASNSGSLITVELRVCANRLDCAVRDNGCGGLSHSAPGHGSRIIEGIAKELGARLNRSFARSGSCVVLSIELGTR